MLKRAVAPAFLVVVSALAASAVRLAAWDISFEPGDVFVSLQDGPVQWHLPDGTLRDLLVGIVPGTGEGMGFDPSGNLYVTRWCIDPSCTTTGNTVEMFDVLGRSWGSVGTGYDCSPHAIVFDRNDVAYVGQAGCSRSILKFVPGQLTPTQFNVAEDYQGAFWVDLAADGCTIFYTSYGPNVKRFDGCLGLQLADFNAAPVPGGVAQDLRVLPDGGVLVSSGAVVARLDATGVLAQTYSVPEASYWAGLDLTGTGTFWAANYETSNVYQIDLSTGAVVSSFTAGTPPHTVVGVRVMR